MSSVNIRILLLSDFNTDNLKNYLNNLASRSSIEAHSAPYGQVMNLLMNPNNEIWQKRYDYLIVWTQPYGVIGSYKDNLRGIAHPHKSILEEVDQFSQAIIRLKKKFKAVFVPTWAQPPFFSGPPLQSMQGNQSNTLKLMTMNLRLAENFNEPDIFILDSAKWFQEVGQKSHSLKLWYMTKSPYSNQLFKYAAQEIINGIELLILPAKKVLALDLDCTLWGGILGEKGIDGIKLGGHDAYGEAYVDFQTSIQSLARRGIILAIVRKNDEDLAVQCIESHPCMVLRMQNFSAFRINWNDKAANLVSIANELNLGLDSFVFIDDSPTERSRIRQALPEVSVPEWSHDPLQYNSALLSLTEFQSITVTNEDRQRTTDYANESKRKNLKEELPSIDDWLKELNIQLSINKLSKDNIERAAQLLNKTNQMNLTTRRLSSEKLWEWSSECPHEVWTIHVSDRFGDSGLTGLVSIHQDGSKATLCDFLLSCRVLGRKVEEAVFATVINYVRSKGIDILHVPYQKTERNTLCLEFMTQNNFDVDKENNFFWKVKNLYSAPKNILIKNLIYEEYQT